MAYSHNQTSVELDYLYEIIQQLITLNGGGGGTGGATEVTLLDFQADFLAAMTNQEIVLNDVINNTADTVTAVNDFIEEYQTGNDNVIIALDRPVTRWRILDGSTDGQLIGSGPLNLTRINAVNKTGSPVYIKLYDTGAVPTFEDTPVYTIPVTTGALLGIERDLKTSERFTNGIGIRVVTGSADDNESSPTDSPIIELRTW